MLIFWLIIIILLIQMILERVIISLDHSLFSLDFNQFHLLEAVPTATFLIPYKYKQISQIIQ